MKALIFTLASFLAFFVGQVNIHAQTWQWAREESAGPEGYGICCDANGNVFLVGYTFGGAIIGSYTITSATNNAVIVKYDADGNIIWVNSIPGAVGVNVACDAAGNVFLCGYLTSSTSINSQTFISQGGNDILLVKFSSFGTALWATSTGSSGSDIANSVCVDSQGNAIISGYISVGTFTFGSSIITNAGGTKYFVAKYNTAGTPQWGICGGGANGTSSSNSVCRDANDDLYITGEFAGTSVIGSNTYASVSGGNDFFIAKFNSAGGPLWSVPGGGPVSDMGYCVNVQATGNIYVTGGFGATFSLSATTLTSSGSSDAFLACFSSNGGLLWAIKGGGTSTDAGYSLATHPGGVYFAGSLTSTMAVFGTATILTQNVSDEMFLCGVDNSGNVTFAQSIDGGGDDVMALAMYNGCSLYLGGDISTHTLILGAFTLTHTSSEALFVAKFNTGINSPTLNLSPNYTICSGGTMTLNATGANTYTWNGGPNTGSYVVSPVVTSSYVVAGTSAAGCSTKSVITVAIPQDPIILSVVSHTPFCVGNTATLSVSAANSYTWTTGATSASIVVSPSVTTIYSVTGIASTGCSYNIAQTVAVIASNTVTISTISGIPFCSGNTATISIAGANTYTWSNGSTSSLISVSPSVTTIYSVTGTSSVGCLFSSAQTIAVVASTPITVSASHTLICKGNSATITVTGASTYSWSNGNLQSTFTVSPASTASYVVTGTNISTGCVSSASLGIQVNPCVAVGAESELDFLIYPNPGPGEFTIRTGKLVNGEEVILRNAAGQVVFSQLLDDSKGRIVSGLAPGIYFLSVELEGKPIVTKKALVQ